MKNLVKRIQTEVYLEWTIQRHAKNTMHAIYDPASRRKHGNGKDSLENLTAAQDPENIANTMAAMDAVMNGKNICSCGN